MSLGRQKNGFTLRVCLSLVPKCVAFNLSFAFEAKPMKMMRLHNDLVTKMANLNEDRFKKIKRIKKYDLMHLIVFIVYI